MTNYGNRPGVDMAIGIVAGAAGARMSGRWAALLVANILWRIPWLVIAFVAIGSGQAVVWVALVLADAAWAVAAHAHGRADAHRQVELTERADDMDLPEAQCAQLDQELTVAAGGRSAAGHRLQFALVAIVSPIEALAYWCGWRSGRDGTSIRELFASSAASAEVTSQTPRTPVPAPLPASALPQGAGIDPSTPAPVRGPITRSGAVVGLDETGELVRVSPRQALLVIGPPGTGKSSGVVNPNTALAGGPVVSTSLKLEILLATKEYRAPLGTLWVFDPGGDSVGRIDGIEPVRWSPLQGVHDWDSAKRIAAAMRQGAAAASRMNDSATGGGGGTDHFERRAASWLSVMLYAGSFAGPEAMITWLGDPRSKTTNDAIDAALQGAPNQSMDLKLARQNLSNLLSGTDTEVSNIRSTLINMVDLYDTTRGVASAIGANFSPEEFVHSSGDSLYIVVPRNEIGLYAPLTVALLEEIFNAQARRYRIAEIDGEQREIHYVTYVLDEGANIAPIDTPSWVSQAGGQGLHMIYCLQDLSQARKLFGPETGQGLLTMFPHKLLLPGIQDRATTETISLHIGQIDQPDVTYSSGAQGGSTSYGTRRIDRMPPDAIARLPRGTALYVDGAEAESLTALAWHDPASQAAVITAIEQGA